MALDGTPTALVRRSDFGDYGQVSTEHSALEHLLERVDERVAQHFERVDGRFAEVEARLDRLIDSRIESRVAPVEKRIFDLEKTLDGLRDDLRVVSDGIRAGQIVVEGKLDLILNHLLNRTAWR